MTQYEPRHAEEAARLANEVRKRHGLKPVFIGNDFRDGGSDRTAFVEALAKVAEMQAAIVDAVKHLHKIEEGRLVRQEDGSTTVESLPDDEVEALVAKALAALLPAPQPDPLVELIRSEMLSGDHPVSDWETQFAAKIRALLEISKKGE